MLHKWPYLYFNIYLQNCKPMQSSKNECQETAVIPVSKIYQSYKKNKTLVKRTPMMKSIYLSEKYGAQIYVKREDLQAIRSFKIRGAGTAFSKLSQEEKQKGVVTASAGNHAQGIAYCCNKFKIKGTIFMPQNTPKLKVNSARRFGGEWLDLRLTGVTFDDAVAEAFKFQEKTNAVFIHAFDNLDVIEGQGGVACQILEDWNSQTLDYAFVCCGGGGLLSGIGCYLSQMSPQTKIIGFEPLGSPSMYNSLKQNKPVILTQLDTFCDGASMKKTSSKTYKIIKQLKIPVQLVDEGLVAKTMLQIYDNQSVILEPAGALSIAGLQLHREQIKGKNVVCILSGSNNDISRLPQIRLRCRLYENREAYYVLGSSGSINMVTIVSQLINPEEEEIILLNSAKKYNASANQIVMGLQFMEPEFKKLFEERVKQYSYTFNELSIKDPLLKILT